MRPTLTFNQRKWRRPFLVSIGQADGMQRRPWPTQSQRRLFGIDFSVGLLSAYLTQLAQVLLWLTLMLCSKAFSVHPVADAKMVVSVGFWPVASAKRQNSSSALWKIDTHMFRILPLMKAKNCPMQSTIYHPFIKYNVLVHIQIYYFG